VRLRGSIELLALPFVAGVALSCAFPWTDPPLAASASLILASAFICLAFFLSGTSSVACMLASFALLGIFCNTSSSLVEFRLFDIGELMDIGPVSGRIDALPFSDKRANALLKALLTGDRSSLDVSLSGDFRKAGAAHILALSGLHLGILYAVVARSLLFLGNSMWARKLRAVLIIPSALIYSLATGASPSIVRAFLFISLRELGRLHPERKAGNLSVFCTALVIQLAISPSVIKSAGFQLSYLAMLGIFLFNDRLCSFFPEAGYPSPMRKLWSMISVSLSCQILTAPLVWFRFHSFPKFFLLTNLLALPLSELFILSGIASLCIPAPFVLKISEMLFAFLTGSLKVIAGM